MCPCTRASSRASEDSDKAGGSPVPRSAEPPRHAAQRHAHSKHTPPTRCEPEDRTTHHQRAKLRRNGGLVSHLSFLPSLEKYFFPDHEVIPASYLGNLVESQPKQLFCYRALVNKGFFAGSSLTKRRMAHAQKRLSPMLRPVPSVRQIFLSRSSRRRRLPLSHRRTPNAERRTRRLRHFPLTCASLVFCRVCACIALPPQLLRSSPRAPSSAPASPDRLALVPQNTCSDANSIWYSHAVTHHGTNQTRRGLNAGS